MKDLEEQVVSLEFAKELKKLEVTQDSSFWWVEHIKSGTNRHVWDLFFGKDKNDLVNKHISGFTVAELGEMLPGEIYGKQEGIIGIPYFLDCGKIDSEHSYYVRYIRHDMSDTRYITHGYNEADARAEMLIYLIKKRAIGGGLHKK
jgi:hypothetical protein